MIALQRPAPNEVSATVAQGVKVTYSVQFNMVEVWEGKKVLAATIVPDRYTMREFISYVNKVSKLFNQ